MIRHPAPRLRRVPLLALGMIALLTAIWGGVQRLGLDLPLYQPSWMVYHGPLMVGGFLGTVIGLERAAAFGKPWMYAAPLLTGLGSIALILELPPLIGPLLIALGSAGLVAILGVIFRMQPALHSAALGLGAILWVISNGLWLSGWQIYQIAPWWIAFLLLTIAGERLELARLLRLSEASRTAFVLIVGVLLSAIVVAGTALDLGVRLVGVALLAMTVWLIRHDVARKTIRQRGLTRFMAVCLLSGYAWLGVSGVLALVFGGENAGPSYDALLHAFFLGFVFAMIFGHAPVIFPAVLGVSMVFRPAFYAHLVLLHLTLLLRVVGDLGGWPPGRQWGGLLNALVLLLFLANTIASVRLSAEEDALTKRRA